MAAFEESSSGGTATTTPAAAAGAAVAAADTSSSTLPAPTSPTRTKRNSSAPPAAAAPAVAKKPAEWAAPLGEAVEELRCSIMHDGAYRDVACNSPPIPFKNGIFEGQAILHMNTGQSAYSGFEGKGKKYRFEVQAQGKFLTKPTGPLYFGAEITKKMELGLLTRAMCGSIMQIGRAINPLLHHSFGDNHEVELPHIVGPMWSLLDRLVITKPGDTPPPLGQFKFEEVDLELRKKRKGDASFSPDIDLESTYSFSFKTSNNDLLP
jgi:hypothetical protein